MARFDKKLPEWNATGTKPPQSMIEEGWKARQKPPADYFNWFFNSTYFALKELQEKVLLASDATNWQKYQTTDTKGLPLSFPITNWDDIFSYDGNHTAFDALNMSNNPPNEGGRYYDVYVFRRTKTTGHIVATEMVQGKVFYRVCAGRSGAEAWRDWVELESTIGSAQKVADLKNLLVKLLPTLENGSQKVAVREGQDVYEEFLNLPAGFYTIYAASAAKNNVPTGKSIRGTIMKTAPNYGYIIAVDYANNLFTNYYDANSGWTGWKTYGTGENVLLFSGSATGIGTQFNLVDDFTKYKYLIVELDGAAGILTLLASTNPRASIVIEFSNIGDDLGNASLYEVQFSVVNNKRFKILHDFGYTLNGNTGSDKNRTKILNIWGAL